MKPLIHSSRLILLSLALSNVQAGAPADVLTDAERARIEGALPAKAPASPAKPRRLLVFDLNVGYPGHRSIHHANLAFALLGKKTGAFETVLSRDPAVFGPESLKRFDAVFLNNTVGNLFEDPALRRSLVEFVQGGGGLLGLHGTTVAFTRWPGAYEDWPEFGALLGGRGARHRESDERVWIKLDSPEHPLVRPFPKGGFEHRDEFFRVDAPYSRDLVRVLLSIDTEKTDLKSEKWKPERPDNDYALAWVRSYGRGRVFYSTIAHDPSVFSDPRMLEFYLGAIQFVLGDLPAPTTPSSRLTPGVLAREKLGWDLGLTAHGGTLFESIEAAARLGLSSIGGSSSQKVSGEIPKDLDPGLTDEELAQVRRKLGAAGVRLLVYQVPRIPGDEDVRRRLFEFGRKLGIEAFICEPGPESLEGIEKLCDQNDIKVAFLVVPDESQPERILKLLQGRGPRIGACLDIAPGSAAAGALKFFDRRLIAVVLHCASDDGSRREPGAENLGRFLDEVYRLSLKPIFFLHRSGAQDPTRAWIDAFNRESIRLAR